jgi:UDPglucose 6-dehydrogenase
MKVMVIGAGYVGLTTSVVLAEHHEVTLVDIDKEKVRMIAAGESPVHEVGLPDSVAGCVWAGRLCAITDSEPVGSHDVVLICVGTPSANNGSVDLTYVEQAIDYILDRTNDLCEAYCVVGIKSTVPPGTTRRLLMERVGAVNSPERFGVVFNPEFLREGSALADARNPDRIVVGADTEKAATRLRTMYEECLDPQFQAYASMSLESAELCKYVSNAFLATKISFANEIANIIEKIQEADIDDVMEGVGLDRRISPSFFGSGVGYGGSCFPKDVVGLIDYAQKKHSLETHLLTATQLINSQRPAHLVKMLSSILPDIQGRKISVLGLAFKPGTDDIRESPSLKVIDELQSLGAEVWVHDPLVCKMPLSREFKDAVNVVEDIQTCLKDSMACFLVTEWGEYLEQGLDNLTRLMKKKIFIDGRRAFVKDSIPSDVVYISVGKHPSS